MIKQYRKKPVVIEAALFSGDNINELWDWAGADSIYGPTEKSSSCFIETLEGKMEAKVGDYIIKGVSGEFYPCKPDIFAKTYEEVGPKRGNDEPT